MTPFGAGSLGFLADHGRWVALHRDLFTVHVDLAVLGANLGRRATAVRCDGRWLVVGPVVRGAAAPSAPDDAGPVEVLVVASAFHNAFVPESAAAWPGAKVLLARGARSAGIPAERLAPLSDGLPPPWDRDLRAIPIEGMPRVNEVVFVHEPSRTLIVADLFFGIDARYPAWSRGLARLVGAYPGPGTSRMFRALVRDRAAFVRSLDRVLEHDVERLVPAHGAIVETGARAALERLRSRFVPRRA